jgi:hypothetical protein
MDSTNDQNNGAVAPMGEFASAGPVSQQELGRVDSGPILVWDPDGGAQDNSPNSPPAPRRDKVRE